LLVEILGIIDSAKQLVRVSGSVGVFTGFWMDAQMPSIGDKLDVEVNIGRGASKWGEDIVEVDAAAVTATGIAFRDGYLYATGRATWAGDRCVLWLQLDSDCLTSVETTGRPDQPEDTPAGIVTVRAAEIELWDTHI
jgi:hypothetical protein